MHLSMAFMPLCILRNRTPPALARHRAGSLILALPVLCVLVGCATVPITGRTQLNMVSDQALINAADQEFSKFMSAAVQKGALLAPAESPQAATTMSAANRVSERIIDAAGLRGRYNWQTVVVNSTLANAFVLPNGKIVIFTGLLPVAKTDAGLAAVLGHEVAHVIARHQAERMSQVLLAQIALAAADIALAASNPKYGPAIGAAVGLGAVYGVLLPFSRAHESEADRIGLILMAKAGYDPAEAAGFWERMQATGGSGRWELLSTHPSHATRVTQIRQWLPEAGRYFAASMAQRTAQLSGADGMRSERPAPGEELASRSSATAIAAVPPVARRSVVQEEAWLLGSWEAVPGESGSVKGAGRFEFRPDGRQIKWTMVRKGWFLGVETTQAASGTITKISGSLVELRGKYDSSNLGVVDQPLRHSLTRDGDRLRGFEIAGDGGRSELTLEKVH